MDEYLEYLNAQIEKAETDAIMIYADIFKRFDSNYFEGKQQGLIMAREKYLKLRKEG